MLSDFHYNKMTITTTTVRKKEEQKKNIPQIKSGLK